MKRPSPTARRLAALAACAALALTACGSTSHSAGGGGSASTVASGGSTGATIAPPPKVTGTLSGPGVTATTITIGQITTTSGPIPGLFQGANDGLDAWVDYVNSEGGIDGRQVVVKHVDDGFSCDTYTNAMKTFATDAFAVVGNFTLEDSCGKSVLQANPNMVDVQGTALDPTLYSIPNVYTPTPNPPGFQTTGYAYFKSRFPNDITHAAQLVGQAAEANGKEQQLAAESLGFKFVYTRLIGNFETNYTSDILRMKADGVKIIDLGSVAASDVADFIQQANQQNFHYDAIVSSPAYDAVTLKTLGNASLADNVLFAPLPYPLYLGSDRATVPAVNTFLTWLDRAHPGATGDIYSVSSWAAGTLLVQAMAGAGSDITQSAVLASLAKVHNFDSQGLVAPTDPGAKLGTHCVLIAGVVNGAWTRVHPSSGFDCSGTYRSIPLSQLK